MELNFLRLVFIIITFHQGICLRTKEQFYVNATYSVTNKTVSDGVQTAIDKFIEVFGRIAKETCLRFQGLKPENRTANIKLHPTYNNLPGETKHCSASGVSPPRLNGKINILDICGSDSVAFHETGHAFGMIHTQRRFDRDDYVTVNEKNIKDDDISAYNPVVSYGADFPYDYSIPYDFGSIMHYSPSTFAKGSGPTMEAKEVLYQNTMGRGSYPSFLDIFAWNDGFKCDCVPKEETNHILGLTGILLEKFCANGGYPDPNNCGKCKCPRGFEGHSCRDPQGLSNPNNTDCGERVIGLTNSSGWQVFHRKWTSARPIDCAWHFIGAADSKVEIRNLTLGWAGRTLLEIKTGRNISFQEQTKPDWRLTGYQFAGDISSLQKNLSKKPIKSVSDRLIVLLQGSSRNEIRLEYRSGSNPVVGYFQVILLMLVAQQLY